MTKILLVEDDKSLREIYGVRLFAEGYDVVSAGDGEEALAVAIKERPALIITDIMMPKISGFDMLDILRSTTETKNIKVIVMTALGSEDNKDRGERLGADRYLVKSQVGIEDVVRVVHEILGDQPPARPAGQPAAPPTGMVTPAGTQGSMTAPSTVPGAPSALPSLPPRPVAPPTNRPIPPAVTRPGMISSPGLAAPGMPANQQQPVAQTAQPFTPAAQQPQSNGTNEPPARRAKVIQPIGDPTQKVDIQALVDKELAKEGGTPPPSTDQQRQIVAGQVDNFASQQAAPPAATPTEPSQLPPVNPQPSVAENPQMPPAPATQPTPPPAQTPPPMSPSANGNPSQTQ